MMIFRQQGLRRAVGRLALVCFMASPADAATLNFTVSTSKPVNVTGVPRIPLSIGPATRYATYRSGTGTSTLTFGYDVQAGDFDANGIAMGAAIDLNGGTIASTTGNPASSLGFAVPDTSGINVQTYTTAFIDGSYNGTTVGSVGFRIFKVPSTGTYSYTISGGGGSVSGGGNLSPVNGTQTVDKIPAGSLSGNQLTLSVTVTVPGAGTGLPRGATAGLDVLAPTGYGLAFVPAYVNSTNQDKVDIQLSGGEATANYSLTIFSDAAVNPGQPITVTGSASASPQTVRVDLTPLGDGLLTASLTLTDAAGNAGSPVTAQITKDVAVPTIVSVTPPQPPPSGAFDDL